MSITTIAVNAGQVPSSDEGAVLTMVYLVDIKGNWASYDVTRSKNGERYFLRNTSKSKDFGTAGYTEYASLYFNSSTDSVDITGDFWRFIDGSLTLDAFASVIDRHGAMIVSDFKYIFAKTDNNVEAMQRWTELVTSADAELLEDTVELA